MRSEQVGQIEPEPSDVVGRLRYWGKSKSRMRRAYAALLRANNNEFRVSPHTRERDLAAIEAWNDMDSELRIAILKRLEASD